MSMLSEFMRYEKRLSSEEIERIVKILHNLAK